VKRILPAMIAGAVLAVAIPMLWRWIARTSNTQVHRIDP
jgi:hypothetical protein